MTCKHAFLQSLYWCLSPYQVFSFGQNSTFSFIFSDINISFVFSIWNCHRPRSIHWSCALCVCIMLACVYSFEIAYCNALSSAYLYDLYYIYIIYTYIYIYIYILFSTFQHSYYTSNLLFWHYINVTTDEGMTYTEVYGNFVKNSCFSWELV